MRLPLFSLGLLALLAFSLGMVLEPWYQSWEGNRTQSANVLQVALGDSRRLFAKHFFVKADAYFHNGYYPTIYDSKEGYDQAHIAADIHSEAEEKEEAGESFLGKPRDWIDAWSRNFFPSRHTHLGDSACGDDCCQHAKEGKGHDENCEHKDHDHGEHESAKGAERELLPWLRLSVEMDPQRVETYVVASYWLRRSLDKWQEAEAFLREGLQHNPGEPAILFELGRIYNENRNDPRRARNVWELALKNWHERKSRQKEPDLLLYAQILNYLAALEEKQANYARAIEHLTELMGVSPNKATLQKTIDDLKPRQR